MPKPRPYLYPRFSPDGNRLAFQLRSGDTWDIWVYDLHRGLLTQLTFGEKGASSTMPVWSPDGR